jgi:hypothetical protein
LETFRLPIFLTSFFSSQGYKARPRSLYCSKKCQAREQNIRQGRVRPVRLSSVSKKRSRADSLSPRLPFHEILSANFKPLVPRSDQNVEKLSPLLFNGLPIFVMDDEKKPQSPFSENEDMLSCPSSEEAFSPFPSDMGISPAVKKPKLGNIHPHLRSISLPTNPSFPPFHVSKTAHAPMKLSVVKEEGKLSFGTLLPSFQSGLPPPLPFTPSPRDSRFSASTSPRYPNPHSNSNSDVDVELIAQVLSSLSSGPVTGQSLAN